MARKIKLLGRLVIQDNGRTSPLTKNTKGCALLAYLVVTGLPQQREHIAELLWNKSSTAQSLGNLRVLLNRIRPWLPELEIHKDFLVFTPAPELDLDFVTFSEAMKGDAVAILNKGLQAYDGDFLSGFYLKNTPRFNEWLLFTREQLRQQMVTAYDAVCQRYVEQKQWDEGVEAAHRWLVQDDLDERAYRWLMACLAGKGQVSKALQHYDICRQRLWQELGVEPESTTIALAEELSNQVEKVERTLVWDSPMPQILPRPGELAELGPLPSNSLIPYRRNSDFVGREETLLWLAESILHLSKVEQQQHRATAITGIGGIGKTQLAVEFCYRYGRFFPGGVYWLIFDDAKNVAEEVANIGGERGMGLFRESEQLTLADKVRLVRKKWQESTRRLLVFDNCEEEKLLADWLPAVGGSQVLLTSRKGNWSVELGVNRIGLAVLSQSEGVSILQKLAPRLKEKEAREIAEEVGHLSLALHLAGGFLRRYQQIQPATYLSQLRDKNLIQHPSLQGRGLSLSPTDHALDVGRTFALSIAQLNLVDEVDEMAYRLLVTAACFAPGEPIPQKLLQETANQNEEDFMTDLLVEDGLARLVGLGFVDAESSNAVVMHRLVAAFILEEFKSNPFLESVQTAVEDTFVRLLSKELEEPFYHRDFPVPTAHLRHIFESALARVSKSAGVLALALGKHIRLMAEFEAAQSILEKGLAVAQVVEDIYTEGRIRAVMSRVYYSQGHHQKAQDNTLEAERLLRLADMPGQSWLIQVFDRRGWAYLRLGQAEGALAAAEEAHRLAVTNDNPTALAEVFNLLGSVQFFLFGKYEEADACYQESIKLHRENGRPDQAAIIMLNQAESALAQGDYQYAKALLLEAAPIIEAANKWMKILSTQISLGEVEVRLKNFGSAVEKLLWVISKAPKGWTYVIVAHNILAEAYLGSGDTKNALKNLHTVFSMEQIAVDPYNAGHAWRILGLLADKLDRALPSKLSEKTAYDVPNCFANSLTLFEEINNHREQAMVLWAWARYEMEKGDTMKGEAMGWEAYEIFEKLNLPRLMASLKAEISSLSHIDA